MSLLENEFLPDNQWWDWDSASVQVRRVSVSPPSSLPPRFPVVSEGFKYHFVSHLHDVLLHPIIVAVHAVPPDVGLFGHKLASLKGRGQGQEKSGASNIKG